jgi:hypothetical protein
MIKKIEQNNRGRGKKTEGKKNAFFVMSPDVFFWNSPSTKRPKTRLKKYN